MPKNLPPHSLQPHFYHLSKQNKDPISIHSQNHHTPKTSQHKAEKLKQRSGSSEHYKSKSPAKSDVERFDFATYMNQNKSKTPTKQDQIQSNLPFQKAKYQSKTPTNSEKNSYIKLGSKKNNFRNKLGDEKFVGKHNSLLSSNNDHPQLCKKENNSKNNRNLNFDARGETVSHYKNSLEGTPNPAKKINSHFSNEAVLVEKTDNGKNQNLKLQNKHMDRIQLNLKKYISPQEVEVDFTFEEESNEHAISLKAGQSYEKKLADKESMMAASQEENNYDIYNKTALKTYLVRDNEHLRKENQALKKNLASLKMLSDKAQIEKKNKIKYADKYKNLKTLFQDTLKINLQLKSELDETKKTIYQLTIENDFLKNSCIKIPKIEEDEYNVLKDKIKEFRIAEGEIIENESSETCNYKLIKRFFENLLEDCYQSNIKIQENDQMVEYLLGQIKILEQENENLKKNHQLRQDQITNLINISAESDLLKKKFEFVKNENIRLKEIYEKELSNLKADYTRAKSSISDLDSENKKLIDDKIQIQKMFLAQLLEKNIQIECEQNKITQYEQKIEELSSEVDKIKNFKLEFSLMQEEFEIKLKNADEKDNQLQQQFKNLEQEKNLIAEQYNNQQSLLDHLNDTIKKLEYDKTQMVQELNDVLEKNKELNLLREPIKNPEIINQDLLKNSNAPIMKSCGELNKDQLFFEPEAEIEEFRQNEKKLEQENKNLIQLQPYRKPSVDSGIDVIADQDNTKTQILTLPHDFPGKNQQNDLIEGSSENMNSINQESLNKSDLAMSKKIEESENIQRPIDPEEKFEESFQIEKNLDQKNEIITTQYNDQQLSVESVSEANEKQEKEPEFLSKALEKNNFENEQLVLKSSNDEAEILFCEDNLVNVEQKSNNSESQNSEYI